MIRLWNYKGRLRAVGERKHPYPEEGPDSSLAGIHMAQSDLSNSLSRLRSNPRPAPVPAPSRLRCVLSPGACFAHCCSVLPGSCPGGEQSLDPQKAPSSRPCLLQLHSSPSAFRRQNKGGFGDSRPNVLPRGERNLYRATTVGGCCSCNEWEPVGENQMGEAQG